MRKILCTICVFLATALSCSAAYTDYLTSERGFVEVTDLSGITGSADDYYILASAENTNLILGVGRYEAKPDWASEQSKALRYASAENTDPILVMSNFFIVEKAAVPEGTYIGFRSVVYSRDMFQTHDNAGFMYVNTYTDPFDWWSYLHPTFQEGYWLFESGKYPISSGNWACGYLGPWNKTVAAGEPLALNRRNTAGDEAGHFRLFRIAKSQLLTLLREQLSTASSSNPVDATWMIVNPSFETGDETGWNLENKDPNGNDEFKTRDYAMSNKDGNFEMNAYQWWASWLGVNQTVENLPSGIYELSGIVATWEGRTVSFTGNDQSVTVNGAGADASIPVSMTVNIGNDQKLAISCGSSGIWGVEGHNDETQTFFKLDNVRLTCKGLFLGGVSLPLPNDETTILAPGQWYYYDVDFGTDYLLLGNLDGMVYSTDEYKLPAAVTTATPTREMTLNNGRIFFKTTRDDATLRITPKRELQQGTFTAVALNVDGLPNTVAGINLNTDGPGSDGTKKISQYLLSKGYDLIGASEDFNYHRSLMESLNSSYASGTQGVSLSLENVPLGFPFVPFDTDGLNLVWKTSKISTANESLTPWSSSKSGEGNEYIKKGFRHYDVTVDDEAVIDVYVLHMDAGGNEYAASREGQWRQLATAINGSDLTRPKLIIGDTNSRWTREEIGANFTNVLNTSLTMSDVWVELCRGNVYPTTAMGDLTDQSIPTNFTNYEVVDKIIYINPKAANTVQLTPQTFWIEQDYTYDTVDHNGNTDPLGDHRPVVVQFSYTKPGEVQPLDIVLVDDAATNSKTIADASGLTANVTLDGRTLYKDGAWNTLCLPFDLTAEQMQQSPLAGATVKALADAAVTGHHVDLTFGSDETSITAGTPYIVKWAEGDDATDVTFENVAIVNSTEAGRTVTKADGHVQFIGYYDAFTIQPETDPSLYYFTGDNTLTYTLKERMLRACRAYFIFSANDDSQALDFSIDFQDSTGIHDLSSTADSADNGIWHSLDGRRLPGKPTVKGVYILDGRKVVIK